MLWFGPVASPRRLLGEVRVRAVSSLPLCVLSGISALQKGKSLEQRGERVMPWCIVGAPEWVIYRLSHKGQPRDIPESEIP